MRNCSLLCSLFEAFGVALLQCWGIFLCLVMCSRTGADAIDVKFKSPQLCGCLRLQETRFKDISGLVQFHVLYKI